MKSFLVDVIKVRFTNIIFMCFLPTYSSRSNKMWIRFDNLIGILFKSIVSQTQYVESFFSTQNQKLFLSTFGRYSSKILIFALENLYMMISIGFTTRRFATAFHFSWTSHWLTAHTLRFHRLWQSKGFGSLAKQRTFKTIHLKCVHEKSSHFTCCISVTVKNYPPNFHTKYFLLHFFFSIWSLRHDRRPCSHISLHFFYCISC